jgi:hypothetical protein
MANDMEYVFFVELSRSMYEKKGGISLLFLMFGATCRNRIGDLLIANQRFYKAFYLFLEHIAVFCPKITESNESNEFNISFQHIRDMSSL